MVDSKRNKDNEYLWDILSEVPDPEIPVINLVEIGVIRDVQINNNTKKISVTITPTYTGCPAKKLFNDLIEEKLIEKGYTNFEIITVLSPAWNTDWLSEKTRAKMLAEGISPPTADNKFVVCPNCKSKNTKVISDFGSTACQSLYSCLDCLEPFSYFKCHV
ncbi:MAG: phenylacetate-CoA oxygenase subunit PaaJ [Crocinitomicaceae bacterium]|nr:phenylacetate-CoA oxygenase subunit PaaJ [Crocinitomicaceae bacterium]